MTATFSARAGPLAGSAGSFPASMMNRFISRMASGSSRCVRTQTFSQRWLQARPRIERQRIVVARDLDRLVELALPHEVHVLRDLLVDGALVRARRLDAVEQPERADGLRPRGVEGLLAVARIGEDALGMRAQVRGRVPGEPGEVSRPGLLHLRRGVLDVLEQAQVAAGLQEVGADGDGLHPAGAAGAPTLNASAPAENDIISPPSNSSDELRGEVHRDRVQGAAGQVHHLLFLREDVAVVLDLERVGELHAELHLARLRGVAQALQHRHGVGVLQVVPERGVRHDDVAVAEPLVQDLRGAAPARAGSGSASRSCGSPTRSIRYAAIFSISSGGQPCMVESVTLSDRRSGTATPPMPGDMLRRRFRRTASRSSAASLTLCRYPCMLGLSRPSRL